MVVQARTPMLVGRLGDRAPHQRRPGSQQPRVSRSALTADSPSMKKDESCAELRLRETNRDEVNAGSAPATLSIPPVPDELVLSGLQTPWAEPPHRGAPGIHDEHSHLALLWQRDRYDDPPPRWVRPDG